MNFTVNGANLTDIANAIRTKGGTSASLIFPDGFISAIGDIQTGGDPVVDYVAGTFTVGNDEVSHTISFGKTFGSYLFIIEAVDASKTTIMSSGIDANKSFAFVGVYPNMEIGNTEASSNTLVYRVNPSSGSVASTYLSGFERTASTLKQYCSALSEANQNHFYKGLTYKYAVLSLDRVWTS